MTSASLHASDGMHVLLIQDAWGLTPLHWAASRGHEACVAILLARQSDPTCTSQASLGTAGKTAADMASSAEYLGIAALLSEASLVQALCKAQTGRAPAMLMSLIGREHDISIRSRLGTQLPRRDFQLSESFNQCTPLACL